MQFTAVTVVLLLAVYCLDSLRSADFDEDVSAAKEACCAVLPHVSPAKDTVSRTVLPLLSSHSDRAFVLWHGRLTFRSAAASSCCPPPAAWCVPPDSV